MQIKLHIEIVAKNAIIQTFARNFQKTSISLRNLYINNQEL